MELFDHFISEIGQLVVDRKIYSASVSNFKGRKGELILNKDAAFTLGSMGKHSANCTLFTNQDIKDEVIVYGEDLNEITSDKSFVRIAIIQTSNIEEHGEQAAYNIMENISLRKYDVFVDGYMVRTSMDLKEDVRVSKDAIKKGLKFKDVGNEYIEIYKQNKYVKGCTIIFITSDDANYQRLEEISYKAEQTYKALNHLLKDLKMDCHACGWKSVCDEVEGMKEMHSALLKKEI
ncbi:MAG: hypothetical protein WBO70_04115 [Erysipelotrichaceae bacterium]